MRATIWFTAGEKTGKMMHDARLIEAHDVDGVGQQIRGEFAGLSSAQLDSELIAVGKALQPVDHGIDEREALLAFIEENLATEVV